MPDDVKQLLVSVDASVALLRQNLLKGDQMVGDFERGTNTILARVDQRFGQVGKPLSGLSAVVAKTRADVATLGNSVDAVERRIRASSAGIKSALLSSTAGIAAAFSADKVAGLADGYTRFTNQLKISGLEGQNLAGTQNTLFAIAQKYGVQLEGLGELYGRTSQAGKSLGATQGDLIKLTTAVGAAQKIQGGSAEQSAGAILQLSQMLGTGTVRAEEFNSVNEGLRPILQAAADASDKYKGSVAALRNDVIAGKVSSEQMFQMYIAALPILEARASKATLTIGASFVTLNNALGKYIGETGESYSATERVSMGISTLADNLDTIVPALATIGLAFAANKVTGSEFAAGLVSGLKTSTSEAALFAQELTRGNVVLIGGKVAIAQQAEAVAAAAQAEVAEIEATIAARRADQVAIGETIALVEKQRADSLIAQAAIKANIAAGFGTVGVTSIAPDAARANQDLKTLIASKRALAVVDAEVAEAETLLAAAQVRAAATTTASTVAATEATLAARAAAAASQLFAGGLTLIGGSVAGGAAVLAIGALIAAIIYYRDESAATTQEVKAFAEHQKDAGATSLQVAQYARAAASGIASVGSQAAGATPGVRAFASATADAAKQLGVLAAARKNELLTKIQADISNANSDAAAAAQRYKSRQQSSSSQARFGNLPVGDPTADARDLTQYNTARATAAQKQQELAQAKAIPLDAFTPTADNNRSRDLAAADSLRTGRRDLTVAEQSGNTAEIADLKARVFELTQYQSYRKQGLSAEAALAQSSKDKAAFEQSSSEKADRVAGSKATREAAAAAKREAAAKKDAANDARAFTDAERQFNDGIATDRAELSGSSAERLKIAKDRVEADRKAKNAEIDDQAKAGRFGTGATAQDRVKVLKGLNDQKAGLDVDLLDQRDRQQKAADTLAAADADKQNQIDLYKAQEGLVTTTAERRDLELKILAIQYDEQRARLEAVTVANGATEAEVKIAAARLKILGQLQSSDTKKVQQDNAGPLAAYGQQLHRDTDDMNEALQGVAVDGIKSVSDGLVGIISGTKSVGQAFKDMAASIIADLARIAVEKLIVSAIGGGLFSTGNVPGHADGEVPGFALGSGSLTDGMIRGPGTGRSDSILALLGGNPIKVSNGESIMTEQATKKFGPVLKAMNRNALRGFANGLTPQSALGFPKMPSIGSLSSGAAGRGQPLVFDLRGALMVPELLQQIQVLVARHSQGAMIGGARLAQQQFAQKSAAKIQ